LEELPPERRLASGVVSWVELFNVLVVCHLVGDFLLQTDWQATHKRGGLGRDPISRRALLAHLSTYGASFAPALVWIGAEVDPFAAVSALLLIALPHLIQDDGRLLSAYVRKVKGRDPGPGGLMVAVDQTFHAVALLLAALLITA
jgi:hypothetical protein